MSPTESPHPLVALLDRLERTFERLVLWCCGPVGLTMIAAATLIVVLVLGQPRWPALTGLPHPPTGLRTALTGLRRELAQAVARPGRGGPAPAIASCPTVAAVRQLTGVPVFRFAEPCGFHWDGTRIPAICPPGYRCTFDLGHEIVVLTGANQVFAVDTAATWRFVAAYPAGDVVRDPCALLAAEQAYAARHPPALPVVAEGFTCPSAPATQVPTASGNPPMGGHDFVAVELRVDQPAVAQARDYRDVILAAATPHRPGGFTTGWLGLDLAPFTGQVDSAQFVQVGLLTSAAGLQWFVYAEPGVVCLRGSRAWVGADGVARGCVGAIGDLVAVGRWQAVELVTYGQGYWIARVSDPAGVSHDVARIPSGSARISRATAVSEEAWTTATDPHLTMAFEHWHPQYAVPGQGFVDWPASGGGGTNALFTAPAGGCGDAAGYGARLVLAGDARAWWTGSGGAVCERSPLF